MLPLSVERRLSMLSSNEKIFNDSFSIYQEALIKTGYNHKLTYQKHDRKNTTDNSLKNKSIGLTPHIVKMLPEKWKNIYRA